MDEPTWIRIATAQLRVQWPHVSDEQLTEAATELWGDRRWRDLPPVEAVLQWLRLGVLSP